MGAAWDAKAIEEAAQRNRRDVSHPHRLTGNADDAERKLTPAPARPLDPSRRLGPLLANRAFRLAHGEPTADLGAGVRARRSS